MIKTNTSVPPYSHGLSVVMPAYNEEANIEQVCKEFCEQVLSQFKDPEYIIINDASTDRTQEILETLKKEYPYITIFKNAHNMGHGPSLLRAYRAASKEFIFYSDADNQILAQEFWNIWKQMETQNVALVTGIRVHRQDPFYRLIITRILRLLNLLLFQASVRDINCPFKLWKRPALARVLPFLPSRPLIISALMLISAKKQGIPLCETPVAHYPRTGGKSFIRDIKIIRLCWNATIELVRFKRNRMS